MVTPNPDLFDAFALDPRANINPIHDRVIVGHRCVMMGLGPGRQWFQELQRGRNPVTQAWLRVGVAITVIRAAPFQGLRHAAGGLHGMPAHLIKRRVDIASDAAIQAAVARGEEVDDQHWNLKRRGQGRGQR